MSAPVQREGNHDWGHNWLRITLLSPGCTLKSLEEIFQTPNAQATCQTNETRISGDRLVRPHFKISLCDCTVQACLRTATSVSFCRMGGRDG
jgi:hypothetical protein